LSDRETNFSFQLWFSYRRRIFVL